MILGLLESLQDVLLIGFGAVIGVNIRLLIYNKLEKINLSKNFIILLINIFSSFCLGFYSSYVSRIGSLSYSYKFGLFFSIGLLGSLSTFSTFIYDLYDLILQLKFYKAFELCIISLTLGIVALGFGFSVARQ